MPKNEVDEFLGDLNNEVSDDVFESQTDDNIFGSAKEPEAVIEEEVVEEKPIPFHKDPKVQRYIDRQVAKGIEEKVKEQPPVINTASEDKVVDVFTRLVGNDTPEKVSIVKELKNIFEEEGEKASIRAYNKFKEEMDSITRADREAENELRTAIEDIEETYKVDLTSNTPTARKERQEFMAFVERIAPKDEDGEVTNFPEMLGAYEVYKETKKTAPVSTRAKDLASRGMTRSSETPIAPKKGYSWRDIDKMFNK